MNPHFFPLPLLVKDLADGSAFEFETVAPFVFCWKGIPEDPVSGQLIEQPARDIVVPAGFRTDFASIPRPLQGFLDAVNDVAPAALVHDFLYTCGMFERREYADRVFLDALRANGVGWIRARTLWAGVRLGGGSHYVEDAAKAADWYVLGAEAADAWERTK